MMDAAFVVIYFVFACVAFTCLVRAVSEGYIGSHKRSDKPEHPSNTIRRLLANLSLVLLGAVFYPITILYFIMRWWNERAQEYNEAKGKGVKGMFPLREEVGVMDKRDNETFSNALHNRYVHALANNDIEEQRYLERVWGFDISDVSYTHLSEVIERPHGRCVIEPLTYEDAKKIFSDDLASEIRRKGMGND